MLKNSLITCVCVVGKLFVNRVQLPAFRTGQDTYTAGYVQKPIGLPAFYPLFLPRFFHGQNLALSSVIVQVLPTIHRPYKYNYELIN
jgi:hypothetical protein